MQVVPILLFAYLAFGSDKYVAPSKSTTQFLAYLQLNSDVAANRFCESLSLGANAYLPACLLRNGFPE